MRAVTLLSGGLDSATLVAIALDAGYEVFGLNVLYGQQHQVEIYAARQVAAFYKIKLHEIVLCHPNTSPPPYSQEYVPGVTWGASALLQGGDRPKTAEESKVDVVPTTYVPARNTFLLGLAASMAEALDAETIFAGFTGGSRYPDCQPQFVGAMNNVLRIGTKAGTNGQAPHISAPLNSMTKAQIIRHGLDLGVPYHLTWSCYNGGQVPCGVCDSCVLRNEGFAELGMTDPSLNR